MQQQQLKSEQARERLQLDQLWDEPIAFRANREIDHEKIRMRRFIGNFQSFGNRVRRIAREFWGAGKIDNLMRCAHHFIRKFAREKDRCLGNAKISRPLFRLVYAMQQRGVFFRREGGVEERTKIGLHGNQGVRSRCFQRSGSCEQAKAAWTMRSFSTTS